MIYFQSCLGFLSFIAIAWLFSEDRRSISFKFVAVGLLAQFVLAVVFLKVPLLQQTLTILNSGVVVLNQVTLKASQFMFGYLAGGATPFEVKDPSRNFVIAFQVLPLIVVVSSISALLFYWRILPFVISILGKILTKIFGLSGPLAFGCSATVFLGTIEAPLTVRPYLTKMSRSEVFTLICCSMSTIAGTVLVLYATVVNQVVPNATAHLLTASVMSIPAAVILAHVMIPPKTQSSVKTAGDVNRLTQNSAHSAMDALIQGTIDGLNMVLQIAAIIIVLFALIYLVNEALTLLPWDGITLEALVSYPLRPFMWLIGISWSQTAWAADLMAQKILFNEFVAFVKLSQVAESSLTNSHKVILTYGLCGFANIASSGIIIGGLTAIMPERKKEVVSLAMRSLVVGNLATLMTAGMAAIIL